MRIYRIIFFNKNELLLQVENKTEAEIMAEQEAKKQQTTIKQIKIEKRQYQEL